MAKRKPVTIGGREYQVLDRLGWQSSAGVYAIEVMDGDKPRIAVSSNNRSPWRWHEPRFVVGGRPCGQATAATP